MKRQHFTLISSILIVTGIILGVLNLSRQKEDSPELRIGLAISLTGFGADFGRPQANAVEMLREKYPDAVFVIEDTKSDVRAGLEAARKLIEVDKVNMIYTDLSNVANAILPLTEERRIILMGAVYLSDFITRANYTVRNLPTGRYESRLVLNELKKLHPGTKTIAAVASNDEFGLSSISDFKQTLLSTDYTLTYSGTFEEDPTKAGTFAQLVTAKNPDAIYISSLSPTLGTMIKQLRTVGFDGPIITTNAFALGYIQEAAGEARKGVIFPDFPVTPATKEMELRYMEKFGETMLFTVPISYEGLSILIDAYRRVGSNPDSIISELKMHQHESVFGILKISNREIEYPMNPSVAK